MNVSKDHSDCSIKKQLQVAKDGRLVRRLLRKFKLQRTGAFGTILFSSRMLLLIFAM